MDDMRELLEMLSKDLTDEELEDVARVTATVCIPLDRLIDICNAERDGRCVILPCKVQDAVYYIDRDCVDNQDHRRFCFCWNKGCKDCEKSYFRVWEKKLVDVRSIIAEMGLCGETGGFGKTVFLTRAEAEAALSCQECRDTGESKICTDKQSEYVCPVKAALKGGAE